MIRIEAIAPSCPENVRRVGYQRRRFRPGRSRPAVLPMISGPTNADLALFHQLGHALLALAAVLAPGDAAHRPRARPAAGPPCTSSFTALALAPGVLNTTTPVLAALVHGDVVHARARAGATATVRQLHVVHSGGLVHHHAASGGPDPRHPVYLAASKRAVPQAAIFFRADSDLSSVSFPGHVSDGHRVVFKLVADALPGERRQPSAFIDCPHERDQRLPRPRWAWRCRCWPACRPPVRWPFKLSRPAAVGSFFDERRIQLLGIAGVEGDVHAASGIPS